MEGRGDCFDLPDIVLFYLVDAVIVNAFVFYFSLIDPYISFWKEI